METRKYCAKHEGKCFQKDNLNEILEKVIQADVLVFATPIYFYSITAQLKAFLDRTVARYTQITNKDLYLIATCADTSKQAITGAKTAIDGWLDCVENVRLKGILYGTNLTNVGDAVKEEKIL
ncbi:MAG: flavodoxin family protein [Clostridia bacterium]